ncbi:MAG: exo-alpha-sialidase [Paenibacillaceae bacterium]|nr:exo-alpha-sialidase [Paenibacillaceae bacterium]
MDQRNIASGTPIPSKFYCDQPYIVITDEGSWLCVMTTGLGEEGASGQHIVSTVSCDQGKTWTDLQYIEDPDSPESSWATPLKLPSGRIYVFYTFNKDNLREVITEAPHTIDRVDTVGYMMYKYSDDHGKSWSKERYRLPIRNFAIDRNNPYGGDMQFFWSVSKPLVGNDGCVYIGNAKVGKFGEGFHEISEGVILKSANILTEQDPAKIVWETLPDGETGIRSPVGLVSDEHNVTYLNDGSLYVTFRTVAGYNGHAYSRDGGHTWQETGFAEYSPGGPKIKHPRAANFVRRHQNGHYTLWFHNNGTDQTRTPGQAYLDRNPAWLSGGIEKDGHLYWSQPEIVLYDHDPQVRISYPDFIEDQGKLFISETQKWVARTHEVDRSLLEGMWNQFENNQVAQRGLRLEWTEIGPSTSFKLPAVSTGTAAEDQAGVHTEFSIEMKIKAADFSREAVIFDATDGGRAGILVSTTARKTVKITLNDGRCESGWECDPGLLVEHRDHHLTIIVDGGPRLILFVVDGVLCDGGTHRKFGWGRFDPLLRFVDIAAEAKLHAGSAVQVSLFRFYDRYLRVSEAVGNYRSTL